ncbi:MAG: hypothetical protein KDB58_01385 [Solirubrobacterales bacterium]|nr:hypothetical protein [Solirubrobacterales bacterium]MCB1008619.1 hypothetical protein [Acidobacteriota bacterium]
MQFKDLLRGTVLLVAVEATGLAAISAVSVNATGEASLAALTVGWWIAAIIGGLWLGRPTRTRRALAEPLAKARTATQLPAESPARIAIARLWPVGVFAIAAGALAPLFPQVPAIATGFALGVAIAWRNREAAVTAVEERDGVCFYVEHGSAFDPVKLIRTPGLMRGAPAPGA